MNPHPNSTPFSRPTRSAVIWLIAICVVVFGMVWLTLAQIRSIAIDHAPSQAEIAECRANLPPEEQSTWTEHCETGPDIIWAARHPFRNAFGVLVITLAVGYVVLVLNRPTGIVGGGT